MDVFAAVCSRAQRANFLVFTPFFTPPGIGLSDLAGPEFVPAQAQARPRKFFSAGGGWGVEYVYIYLKYICMYMYVYM